MQRRLRSRTLWIALAAVLVVALGAGLWLGRPVYRSYKEKRAMARAKVFQQKGDLRNQALSLRQALAYNPANLEAVLMMSELARVTRSPQLLGWRKRAADLDPSVENRLLLAASALQIERPPFAIATATLNELATIGATNANYHQLASQLALRLNRIPDAVRHLENAAQLEPTNRLHQLNLSTLRLQANDPAVADLARVRLRELADDTNYSAIVLRSLVADALRRKQFDDARQWVDRLMTLDESVFPDRLLRLTVLEESRSPELPDAIRTVQEVASTNTPAILAGVRWMLGQQRAQEALDWIQSLPPPFQQDPGLRLARADCHLVLKDWSGLNLWLDGQHWQDLECVRQALISKALRELGLNDLANLNWRRAVASAGTQPEAVAVLSRLAATWGWDNEFEIVLWTWIAARDKSARTEWAFRLLTEFYQSRNNTAGLYRVHQVLMEKNPESLILMNNTAMIALLLNRDLNEAQALAQNVYNASRTNAIFASTYAYALHMQGRTEEALQVMQTLPEEELVKPQIALYQAVMLRAAGRNEQAKPYTTAARRAPLMLPEEAALLKSLEN